MMEIRPCPICGSEAELEERIVELERQWDARDSDCLALEAKVNRLEDERDELQIKCYEDAFRRDELIRDMCEWLSDDAIGIFAERMRELGIEVDR